ncbi:MAG: ABC transporter permease [Geminicoccaceae bacterium]
MPVLIFILVTFVVPIAVRRRSTACGTRKSPHLPETAAALQDWDGEGVPGEPVFAALAKDLTAAAEARTTGLVGARLNYEISGMRSTIQRAARRADQLEAPFKEAFIELDDSWGDPVTWRVIKRESQPYTASFFLAALDRTHDDEGNIVRVSPDQEIYVPLFLRTLWISLAITALTLLLGFPIAYLMAHLPMRIGNLLMILVLLPFWTSLLVRTTSWIVLLQRQGVINDVLVWSGLIDDDGRLTMVHNLNGTIVAMTHILLPFMVLPLCWRDAPRTAGLHARPRARSLGANRQTPSGGSTFTQTTLTSARRSVLVFTFWRSATTHHARPGWAASRAR